MSSPGVRGCTILAHWQASEKDAACSRCCWWSCHHLAWGWSWSSHYRWCRRAFKETSAVHLRCPVRTPPFRRQGLRLLSPVWSTHGHCTRQANSMTLDNDLMEKPSRSWRRAVLHLTDVSRESWFSFAYPCSLKRKSKIFLTDLLTFLFCSSAKVH